jgi:DNA replication protein DnaC
MWKQCELVDFIERNLPAIGVDQFGKQNHIRCGFCREVIFENGTELEFCCKDRKDLIESQKAITENEIKRQREIEKADQNWIYNQAMTNSGFEGFEKSATFKNFIPVDLKQANALQKCREFIDSAKPNMILAGSVGAGKTHLACATAKYYGYYSKKTFGIMRCSSLENTDLERYKTFDTLIIDDIGRETGSEFKIKTRVGIISDVIEHRYRNEMKTIYTTNFSVEELVAKFGSHIVDRMLANSIIPERIEIQSYRGKQ